MRIGVIDSDVIFQHPFFLWQKDRNKKNESRILH